MRFQESYGVKNVNIEPKENSPKVLDVQGVSGSSPLAPTIFCSNVYAQLLLTFRLCVSIKTKYFVLIILILATRSQTPLLRQIRFVQSCIPSISHCKGMQMHTDLRRVFSPVGSFGFQGAKSEIKKALQTSI